ncbi:MAG TPA: hypothetical protein PKB07_09435 [Flavilitoribacter sp.]|nr:hypothetical protein [Flavilitoribacter sp.]
MKRRKWTVWLGILLVLFAARGALFRGLVKYRPVAERSVMMPADQELKALIEEQLSVRKPDQPGEIIKIARSITARKLSFALRSAPSNPDEAYRAGKANCIGYAALYASVCQQMFRQNGWADQFQASHKVGKIYFLGYDVHRLFKDPFFKDHDYVEIRDAGTGSRLCIDPSLGDYTGIYRVRAD